MNQKLIIFIILFLHVFFCGQIGRCADVLGQKISTNEFLSPEIDFPGAIKYSLEHNNNIRAIKNGLSATERDIGIAKSTMMPQFRINENLIVTNSPSEALVLRMNQTRVTSQSLSVDNINYPGCITNFLTAGVLEQKIIDPKAMIEIKMAKKYYSANGYTYLRNQEELVSEVALAYLKISTDKELVDVAKQAINDANRHLNTAQEKLKHNEGAYSDILRGKSAVKQREENLISAQRDLDIAKRNLGFLLGLEVHVEISNSVPDINLHEINYYKSYSIFRNDIKASEIRVENAKNNIKSAQSEWYPTLTAMASYNFYNSNYPFGGSGSNFITGAFLRWDMLDGNKRKYEILKAKDKEAEAKEYLEWLRKKVSFRIYEVYTNVEEHKKNLELAIEAEKQAEQDEKLVEAQWQKSELPLVSLIDAQINLNDARVKVVKNKFDLKEDLINLVYESGIIYQELALK